MNVINMLINHLKEMLATSGIHRSMDTIVDILNNSFDNLDSENQYKIVAFLKDTIQKEANIAIDNAGGDGAVIAATGSGKSKVAINRAIKIISKNPEAKILIVVPLIGLKLNWRDEFIKWGYIDQFFKNIEILCYASLSKERNETYDLVVFDELHNITPNHLPFFKYNSIKNKIGLTATIPHDKMKRDFLTAIKLLPVYRLNINEATDLRIVTPYHIYVVDLHLNNVDKTISVGGKTKKFKVTERNNYDYLSKLVSEAPTEANVRKMLRFLKGLESRTNIARLFLKHVIPPEIRTIIFCASIEQADQLSQNSFHSKKRDKSGFAKFCNMEVNEMSCVDAVNEGHNISNVDCGFMLYVDSTQLSFEQRLGRVIRFRPGKTGTVIILNYRETREAHWVRSALAGISSKVSRVTYLDINDLRTGKIKIPFN